MLKITFSLGQYLEPRSRLNVPSFFFWRNKNARFGRDGAWKMLQRLLSAVFTKLDCSIFSLMFLLFRWREAHFNGTGRWIFKKTGVRKTTVIASIMFLTELVLFLQKLCQSTAFLVPLKRGLFPVSHVQSLLPGWKGMLWPFWITCSLVSDRITGLRRAV